MDAGLVVYDGFTNYIKDITEEKKWPFGKKFKEWYTLKS